jgi:serine/tyrosine/threonine adenylyltransferase
MPLVEGPSLAFDNSFVRELPGDPSTLNAPRHVLGACYTRVEPTPVRAPKTMAYAVEVARLLGLDERFCESEAFAQVFSGNARLAGMQPWAACYGGHQFGHWAGQLGDGRAISLGEVLTGEGQRWELQLKGAGLTPYSRSADGRAVLRSSIREFLCSEAMHHLGVPTTRALSLVTTGEKVVRDMFYDGNPRSEPGAIVCRVAPTFLRFGNFEIFAARRDQASLRRLLDYTIATHFPELGALGALDAPSRKAPDVYVAWLAEVARRTAVMVAHWTRVGFVHGVMNTDNMSILGLTIDYGPYGWLDDYDPDWTPNTTDAQGRRYRFGHQPRVALWNVVRLAEAIASLVDDEQALKEALQCYQRTLDDEVEAMMASKLGLRAFEPDTDVDLVGALMAMLPRAETDMTIFYRRLADLPCASEDGAAESDEQLVARIGDAHYGELTPEQVQQVAGWLRDYRARVRRDGRSDGERRAAMNRVNPKYVPRNYLAQQAIDRAEAGDPSMVRELLEVMRRPYDEQPEREAWAGKRPDWARDKPGCSMLSCSS